MGPLFTVTLNYKRSTKGTHLYETTGTNDAIANVYIKKAAFTGEPPKSIQLDVTGGE